MIVAGLWHAAKYVIAIAAYGRSNVGRNSVGVLRQT